jgi:hypothetical protein
MSGGKNIYTYLDAVQRIEPMVLDSTGRTEKLAGDTVRTPVNRAPETTRWAIILACCIVTPPF